MKDRLGRENQGDWLVFVVVVVFLNYQMNKLPQEKKVANRATITDSKFGNYTEH